MLARRRYFDEGVPPADAIGDAIFQSWAHCQRIHRSPAQRVAFAPVSVSRSSLALQRSRGLVDSWHRERPQLEALLGATACAAMLTDSSGVLIGSACVGRAHERVMPVATRTGVNLSEDSVGTTAPGLVARTGRALTVLGAEHFFEELRGMFCTAAPIRDVTGRVAGVLDISSESMPFSFDASAVVGMFASAIENRLLLSQSHQQLVIRFQIDSSLLDSTVVALVGISTDARLVWHNAMAARFLGLPVMDGRPQSLDLEEHVGASFAALASIPAEGAHPVRLPSGLVVWARADRQGDGVASSRSAVYMPASREVSEAPSPTAPQPSRLNLWESERDAILRTLRECSGNVSQAAKRLGVSRGLIYRRIGADR